MPASSCITVEIGQAKDAQPASCFNLGNTDARTDTAKGITSNLKAPRHNETDNHQQRTSRLVATNHDIDDVDWLQDLSEQITWIQGDPIHEISNQLRQRNRVGIETSELHIVAHGNNGDVKLGNTFLTKQYLEKSAQLLQSWKLEAIYLWSCEAGLNAKLITALKDCTEAEVYTSKSRISREHPNISNGVGRIASLEELIGQKQLRQWENSLFAAPFLGKAASSYEEITISVDTISAYLSSPPPGLTISAQTLVDDGAGNISLSSASTSHISIVDAPSVKGFGVTGNIASGDTRELGYHNPSGLSEKITLEFDEIVPEIGFATSWLADVEGDGIYKMYRDGVLVKTGAVDGETDQIDPDVTLSSDDGYGFDKIEFTANGFHNDYLIHKIIYDAPKANNAATASVNELDDASSQDIASQTGSLTVSESDNSGTITASIVGEPIITLNGSSYTLPASANALTADGAMSISPTSQTWGGSWTPITWTYNPASADLDFVPAGQDLVIGYDIRLNDGTNNSNAVRVEITIVGENDAPSISDATYTLDEDTAAGTIFHDTDEDSTGNDTDIESETITYSITAGNPDGIFSIDSNTGEISIAAGQSLDYETDDQHILTVKASDSAESDTATVTVNVNNVRPKIAITDDDADNSLGKGDTSTITFTLTEASTDFVQSDVTVSGGTFSNWNTASSTVYTATFTPAAESTTNGEIHVTNDKFSDGAGDTNQDETDANNTVTLTVDTTTPSPSPSPDTTQPTITISSDVTSLKAAETAAITFTLSETSTNFVESDITITGGSLSDFSGSGTSYSATFTPTTNSTANGVIHVANDKFSDAASNNNQDESDANNSVTLTIDTIRPTIAISSDVTSLKAAETAAISFTLSETSTNFVESDITITGGSLSDFSGSGTSYSATFTPTTNSTANGVIHVANDKFSDAASNNNQDESDANNTVTLTVDTIRPTIAISSDVTSLKAAETAAITFTLSETSTNFVESDITITGGSLSDFSGSGTSYSATFTPDTNSTTNGGIHIANDKFSDAASNNNQDESDANNTVTLTVDTIRPTIAISSDVTSLKAAETAAITFTLSETSTNFVESDITITGGSLSDFSGSGTSYSATFTPDTNSTTNGGIHIANDKFSDAASNNNQDESDANNTVTLTVDTIRPTIAISSDVTSLKAAETAAITFTLSETSTNFVESDITITGGSLSDFSGSGTSYSATFTPDTNSTTNGGIHIANDKFSDAASNNNQDESDANNTVTLTVDTTTPSTSPSPSTSPNPESEPAQENTGDVYLLVDTSTSMLRSGTEHRHHYQSCLVLKAFTQDIEQSGFQFQRTDTKSAITASNVVKNLSRKAPKQAIKFLENYNIIDRPDDGKNAGRLNVNLITYDYGVQHKSFALSRKNPDRGIGIMRTILSMDMAGEKFGNSIKNNQRWKKLNLPKPSQLDLFQASKSTPSNLYAGTEMLGALEGLEFLLNKKANDPNRQKQSTTVAMVMDGRPERRSWWDTRTNAASDSIIGQAIPLPKSLGKEDITTSGLLYDNKGRPHFFKNNKGQWQWQQMQKDLNAALDRLAGQSTNPASDVQVNLYGLGDASNASLDKIYQDLFSRQTFNNSSNDWHYSFQTIQSLLDITS